MNYTPEKVEEAKGSILERIKALNDRLKQAEEADRESKAKIEELQAQVAELRTENAKLRSDYHRLKLAKAYAWNEESKRNATLRVNTIVREIDNCLAELKKDINL